jgi:Zn-dependent M16 (insulinase) family peptidase
LEELSEHLTYQRVVYNEMKGVYSSPDSLLQREAQQSIFPDNTYGVDSGGDPVEIPNLSFEQFAEFHKKFYHPANSRIFFAGDDDVAKRLEIMDEYLSDFEESPESKPGSVVEYQKKTYDAPKLVRKPYPAGADQPETHMIMVNWLVNDREFSPVEEITITVLDHLLMGTTSSILRKTLMESGLGDAITGGGLMTELLQGVFSVGLTGVKPEDVSKVEELVVETLKKVAEEGFSEDAVAASMNTIEFDVSETCV